MKNIVLLGASNCLVLGGFREAFLCEGVKVSNLSATGMNTMAKIYELYNPKNKEILSKADLIIIEGNIIDISDGFVYDVKEAVRMTYWTAEELARLGKKVLILFLPVCDDERARKLSHVTRKICNNYGFNIIDYFSTYKKMGVLDFYMSYPDSYHQLYALMQAVGKKILSSLEHFRYPKILKLSHNPKFALCSVEKMIEHTNTRGGGGG